LPAPQTPLAKVWLGGVLLDRQSDHSSFEAIFIAPLRVLGREAVNVQGLAGAVARGEQGSDQQHPMKPVSSLRHFAP
jgi:hypothetical protein